jgi:hypothetical protein
VNRHVGWLLSISCVVCQIGCDRGPELVDVQGTVTLDGKPLPFKGIYFFPDRGSGTEGNGGGGFTNPEGKYFLVANLGGTTTDQRGIQPGKYRVTVAEPVVPMSEKDFTSPKIQQPTDIPAPAIGATAPMKREIPMKYATAETTPLLLEVPKTGGTLDIELTKNP